MKVVNIIVEKSVLPQLLAKLIPLPTDKEEFFFFFLTSLLEVTTFCATVKEEWVKGKFPLTDVHLGN